LTIPPLSPTGQLTCSVPLPFLSPSSAPHCPTPQQGSTRLPCFFWPPVPFRSVSLQFLSVPCLSCPCRFLSEESQHPLHPALPTKQRNQSTVVPPAASPLQECKMHHHKQVSPLQQPKSTQTQHSGSFSLSLLIWSVHILATCCTHWSWPSSPPSHSFPTVALLPITHRLFRQSPRGRLVQLRSVVCRHPASPQGVTQSIRCARALRVHLHPLQREFAAHFRRAARAELSSTVLSQSERGDPKSCSCCRA